MGHTTEAPKLGREVAIKVLPAEMRTCEGVVMSTVPYMSPEQVQGRTLQRRTDIFSLGVILCREVDAAFEVFARAENGNQLWLYYTGLPGFDPLRADPRFAVLVARLGLPFTSMIAGVNAGTMIRCRPSAR